MKSFGIQLHINVNQHENFLDNWIIKTDRSGSNKFRKKERRIKKKNKLELNLSLWQVRWYAIRDTQKLILRTINYTQLTLKLSANKIGTHLDKWMRYKAKENIYTVKLALEYIWILALICIIKMTSYDIGLIRNDRLVMIYLHTQFGRNWTNGCWVMKQRKMPVVRMRTVSVLWDSRRDI